MSERSAGLRWFRGTHGATDGKVRVSRYYPTEKSWGGQPAWAFEFPLEDLESPTISVTYCVCQSRDGRSFCCLRVPHEYLLSHRTALYERTKKGTISVFLAADTATMFRDVRGTGGVGFGQFLLPSP